jgi:hypothetical protein
MKEKSIIKNGSYEYISSSSSPFSLPYIYQFLILFCRMERKKLSYMPSTARLTYRIDKLVCDGTKIESETRTRAREKERERMRREKKREQQQQNKLEFIPAHSKKCFFSGWEAKLPKTSIAKDMV